MNLFKAAVWCFLETYSVIDQNIYLCGNEKKNGDTQRHFWVEMNKFLLCTLYEIVRKITIEKRGDN